MLKAVIFDLDGVIVNTVPIHFKAWKKMFGEYGIKFTFNDYKKKVDGIPRIDGARAILKNINGEELNKAAARKQSYFLKFLEENKIQVYKSTIKLIDDLKKSGIKIAVISSSKNCQYILDKINLTKKLDAVITGNDITKGKPDPQVFLLASQKSGVKPQECIVFEDAVLGVLAAKRAGMICVGIDRYEDRKRLKKADIVIKDAKDITSKKLETFLK